MDVHAIVGWVSGLTIAGLITLAGLIPLMFLLSAIVAALTFTLGRTMVTVNPYEAYKGTVGNE